MQALVPDWANHYGEFWRAIRVRNLWFIHLRYFAVVMLAGFILIGETLLDFRLTTEQLISMSVISLIILSYNIVLHKTRKYVGCEPGKLNCLHLSLLQMILDLIALMMLVYFTGTIESPLYMFFNFHMIIGSLILPGYIVYSIAAFVSFSFSSLVILQHYGLLKNFIINGLYGSNRPYTLTYDILFIIVFMLMLFISVYLGNKISRQLYKREQQLRTTLEKLNEAEKAKQRYIIGVVHEVKTPLTAIHSIIDLILKKFVGPISADVEYKLERALIRTDETLHLLNNILRLSKLKLLDIKTTEEIDVNNFILSLLDKHHESIKTKNVSLVYKDLRKGIKSVRSDKILLELALSNILANSIKYVNEKGAIEILLGDCDNGVVIELSDNGIGIPKGELKKVFDQFYRASNVDRTRHEGSGMGLAVVKEIIEMLEGEIKIESPSRLAEDEHVGTTFTITLPYRFQTTSYDIFEVNDQDYLSSKSNF